MTEEHENAASPDDPIAVRFGNGSAADAAAGPWRRRAEIIIYAFLGTSITSGLLYEYYSVFIARQWRHAVFGAVIVIVGSCAAWMMLELARIGSRVAENAEQLRQIKERLHRLDATLQALLEARSDSKTRTEVIEANLSAMGGGDAAEMLATSIQGSIYPRLAHAETGTPRDRTREAPAAESQRAGQAVSIDAGWRSAIERQDIDACRRILDTADGRIDPERRAAMHTALIALLDDRKQSLRNEFSRFVREGRFTEALAKGAEIEETFPDGAMADEFRRIRPYLVRQARENPPNVRDAAAD